MATLTGKSVASTYDQIIKRQDSYSAGGNQIEIMDDSGTIKTTPLYLSEDNAVIGTAYGIEWDESADTYTRVGDLDTTFPIQKSMKRCLLNDDGTVNYYLQDTDSTLKADGTSSTLTGADGQVMVEIPKFWYKYSYSGTTHRWEMSPVAKSGYSVHEAFNKNGAEVDYRYIGAYEGIGYDASTTAYFDGDDVGNSPSTNWPGGTAISTANDKLGSVSGYAPLVNETRAEFRAIASNRGSGWRQLDYDLASAVQLLYLIEYNDFDSQTQIGEGRTQLSGGSWTKDSYIGVTGKSNSDGNGTGNVEGNSNNAYMSYRGIENIYGNVWKFVDGININSNVPYVSNNDSDWADDTTTNYTDLGVTLHNGSGYQGDLEQISRGFLPADVTGSSSTKITDYYYQGSGWRVFVLGGHATNGSPAGVFYLHAEGGVSYAHGFLGGRVCF